MSKLLIKAWLQNPIQEGKFPSRKLVRNCKVIQYHPKEHSKMQKLLIDIRNSCIERGGQDQSAAYPNPHINITGVSKEHIHSGLSCSKNVITQ